jgi:hypothetical protein
VPAELGSGRVVELGPGVAVGAGVGVVVAGGALTVGTDGDPPQAARRAVKAMPPARPSERVARRKRKADLLERREGAHLLGIACLLL